MGIISVVTQTIGTAGQLPVIIYLNTTDSDATIGTTGYLNQLISQGYSFFEGQMALVNGTDGTSFWDVVVTISSNGFRQYSLVINTDGAVTSVTATSPVLSSGGLTPNISLVNQGVSGTYTGANLTCDEYGIITAISNGTSSNLPFTVLTTGTTIAANNGYIINAVSSVHMLLPASFNVGDEIWIVSINNSPWRITQNAGQKVVYGGYASTSGTGGYVDSLGPDTVTNCRTCTLVGTTANNVLSVGVAISDTLNFQ